MAETITLNNILSDLRNTSSDGVEKTAAAADAPTSSTVSNARDELLAALDTTDFSKTAEPDGESAVAAVEKIASDVAASEAVALEKEAHFYGSAVADGFMARIGQHGQSIDGIKTAGASDVPTEDEFEKFASENPELVKQAEDLGYRDGMDQVEMLKQAAYEQGYKDTVAQIEDLQATSEGRDKLAQVAQDSHAQEMQKIGSEIDAYSKTAEGREAMPHIQQGYAEAHQKIAAARKGYAEAVTEINKVASACFDNGFRQTIGLLGKLSA